MQGRTLAVVTSDVNAPTSLQENDARRLEYVLQNCYQDFLSSLPDAKIQGFTDFRGDSWQFVVVNAAIAVRATLLYRYLFLGQSASEFKKNHHLPHWTSGQ